MKDILRACLFALTLMATFVGLGSYGMYFNEGVGEVFLVLGAFGTSFAVTAVLAWFASWLFADDKKPAEKEPPTTDENQDATT